MLKNIPAKLLLCSLFFAVVLPTEAVSATAAGKVRSVLGTVDRWKAKQSEWSALRVGASIHQYDKVRTGVESEVIFGLPDGSSISVAEKTIVEMTDLLKPNSEGGFETKIDVREGHVNFAVRKLKDKKSKFIFKTGTATASIRGTEGYIGGNGILFAGLKTGKLDIVPDGSDKMVSITAGETAFGGDSLVVVKLASSGDARFAKRLEKILADRSKSLSVLLEEVQRADSSYQEQLKEEAKAAAAALPENGFSLTTSSPADVCDEGLSVEGTYRTTDESAMLILKVGNGFTSENLIRVADGNSHSFAQKVLVNDENGLWNVSSATLTFSGAGVTSSKTIDLKVNRGCAEVNRKVPTAMFTSYDSLRCFANLSVNDMQNDVGILTVASDGSQFFEEAVTKNTQKRIKLKSGRHDYVVKVEDQAGNKAEVQKSMGCYPTKRFNIEILGKAKEILKVPPPPKDIPDRITQTLQFRIRLPDNAPENLYKVTVKQNGKVILQETLTQIQNLDYQIPVELTRGAPNHIDIEAIHKSGYKAKAKKVYEVR